MSTQKYRITEHLASSNHHIGSVMGFKPLIPICAIGALLLISPVMADKANRKSDIAGSPAVVGDWVGSFSDYYNGAVIITERPVTRRQEGRTTRGFSIEIIELKRRVSYADLDLSRQADVTVFESRVETAAKRSCEELALRHSIELMDRSAITRCTKEAVVRSVKQVQSAIAANH